jgi:hypothetical protein
MKKEKHNDNYAVSNALINVALAIIIWCTMPVSNTVLADYPSIDILNHLEKRLLEKPECLPDCADISQMNLSIYPDRLKMILTVHAAIDTILPLPSMAGEWLPEQITIDTKPATGIRQDLQKHIWVYIKKGRHQLILRGQTPHRNQFHMPFQIKPKHIKTQAVGWEIQGISDGQIADSLQFNRIQKNVQKMKQKITIPPFFHVERVLYISLQWHVVTTVKRITPASHPVSIEIPLLDGESLMTGQLQVKNKNVLVSMSANQSKVQWQSVLEYQPKIHLVAPQTNQWVETWILDADTQLHIDFEGIPVIHHQDSQGKHRPTWQPWPSEILDIKLSKLKPIDGKTMTIDQVKIDMHPGKLFHQVNLSMHVRVSMGQTHTVKIPEASIIQQILIDRQSLPVAAEQNYIKLPMDPGAHHIEIKWHHPEQTYCFLKFPQVQIGAAVNTTLNLHLPGNAWILWTNGPKMGPVVLFWGYLILLLIISFALANLNWTPLRAWQWFLLGLGLSQTHFFEAIVVVGWFLLFYYRKQNILKGSRWLFNIRQLGLIVLSVAALFIIYEAIHSGLLGIPQMQIKGNGSSWRFLSWYIDQIDNKIPQPWVIYLPLFMYRIAMLLWALWMAHSLIQWIRWMWMCFSEGGIFRVKVNP